jgi:hypothetical protein
MHPVSRWRRTRKIRKCFVSKDVILLEAVVLLCRGNVPTLTKDCVYRLVRQSERTGSVCVCVCVCVCVNVQKDVIEAYLFARKMLLIQMVEAVVRNSRKSVQLLSREAKVSNSSVAKSLGQSQLPREG